MKKLLLSLCCLFVSTGFVSAEEPALQRNENWPTWRGPLWTGVAPMGNPPTTWSEEENVQWKIDLPGLGYASPIVWGDQVIILTAVEKEGDKTAAAESSEAQEPPERERRGRGPRGGGRGRRGGAPPSAVHDFVVMSVNRRNGDIIWQKTANSQVPHEAFRMNDNSFASASPITDGQFIYASFGSYGIYCYDMRGNQIWKKDLGDFSMRNSFGEGSSPTLYQDRLIVTCDQENDSFITALNTKDGEVVWRVPRDEASSWSTPLVVEHAGKTQVIVNGANRVRSYDLENGDVIWECGGQTGNVVPVPLLLGENVICMSGWRGSAIFSLPLSATGDITGTDTIDWHYDGSTDYRAGTPYVPSPLLYDGALYFLKSYNGILTRMSAETGEVDFDNQRLNGISRVYSSPVGAAGRVYITGRGGKTIVLKLSEKYEVLAENELDASIDATPAIVGNQMIIRSQHKLYCLGEK